MKYIGLSIDENYLFTDKGFYVLNESSRFVPYNINMLSDLSKIQQTNSLYEYKNGNISLIECISQPKKFLNLVMETFHIPIEDKMNVLIEWEKKFEPNYLLNESSTVELITESLNQSWNEVDIICEGIWDSIKSGASSAWEGIKKGASSAWEGIKKGLSVVAQKVIIPIIKQGIIPFMRWIRRNLNTYFGIIADVILSLFPTVVVMKMVWGLIVLLDIYEIATGDYDPNDPERQQMPFLFLITDLVSLIFTAAAGKTASLTLKQGIKELSKSPASKRILTQLLEKLPGVGKFFKQVQEFLIKLFGPSVGGFVGKLLGYVDSVITKLVNWIKTLFKQTKGKLLTKGGAARLAVGTGLGVGMAEFFKEKTMGEGDKGEKVKQFQKALLMIKNSPSSMGGIPSIKFNGPVNGVFGPSTTEAVKQVQKVFKLPITGKVDPKLAFAFGVEMGPGNFERIVGVNNMSTIAQKMNQFNFWLEDKFGKYKATPKNK